MSEADAASTKPVEETQAAAPAAAEAPVEAKAPETTTETPAEETAVKEEAPAAEAPAADAAAPSEAPKADILKTTAKIDRKDPKKNRKFDPESREVTDDPEAIRKQVGTNPIPPRSPAGPFFPM